MPTTLFFIFRYSIIWIMIKAVSSLLALIINSQRFVAEVGGVQK